MLVLLYKSMNIGNLAQKLFASVADKFGERLLDKIEPKVHSAVASLYDGDELSSGTFTITHSNEDINVHIENKDVDVVAWAESESGEIQSRNWTSVCDTVDSVSESAVLSVLDVVFKQK